MQVHSIALERQGHGEELCKTMDITPFDVLCFIGGDGTFVFVLLIILTLTNSSLGTFHECVNGLLKRADGKGSQVPIAMIAGGTGNSFSLELLGDTDIKLSVDTIIRGVHVPIDVGKVVQLDVNGDGSLKHDVRNPPFLYSSVHKLITFD